MRWNIAILPLAMTLAGCVGVETMPEPRGNGGPAAHPLDPLTAGEIDAAVAILKTAGKLSSAAEKTSSSKDAAVERTRQEVKMLDDLYKTVLVLFTEHLFTLCPPTTIERNSSSVDKARYVKDPKTLPAASASKALFAEMTKKGWHEVRVLGLTDKLFNPDNKPSDAFEQAAAKKLLAGKEGHEEVVEKGGKRYLRVATGIPVVMEQCLMCHPTWKGNKGNIGALSYTVPVVEYDWSVKRRYRLFRQTR